MHVLIIILTFIVVIINWIYFPKVQAPYKGRDIKRYHAMCIVNGFTSSILAVTAIGMYNVDYLALGCLAVYFINMLIIRAVIKFKVKGSLK